MKVSGQSLQEYGLVIGLVVLASVGTLSLMGTNVSALLGGMITRTETTPGGGSAGSGVNQPMAPLATGSLPATASGPNTPMFQTMRLRLADGTPMVLPNYPTNLVKSVETVGADGGSKQLADVIKLLAKQLEQEGKLDSLTADTLRDLANTGYDLANAQEELERGLDKSYSSMMVNHAIDNYLSAAIMARAQDTHNDEVINNQLIQAFLDNPLGTTTGGKSNLSGAVSSRIKGGYLSGEHGSNTGGSLTDNILIAYYEAAKKGALKDPAVKDVVQDSIVKILALNTDVGKAITLYNDSKTQTTSAASSRSFRQTVAANMHAVVSKNMDGTRHESGTVCTTGGDDASSGVGCH